MKAVTLRSLIPSKSELAGPEAFGFNLAINDVAMRVAMLEASGYVLVSRDALPAEPQQEAA